jgi:hypothetical protein
MCKALGSIPSTPPHTHTHTRISIANYGTLFNLGVLEEEGEKDELRIHHHHIANRCHVATCPAELIPANKLKGDEKKG